MSGGFESVLEQIRNESKNTVDLGRKFEKITRDFLEIDPLYTRRFKKIWMWSAWPKRDGNDTGIDLIAEQYDGGLCAIQCKCYADDGSLNMKAVATFLSKASSLKIPQTILVYTGDAITSNALKVLRDSGTQILRTDNFISSGIDWNNFPKLARITEPKKLRLHQSKAVEQVLNGFSKGNRGKMIMACGTGKTLTSLHIAEKLAGAGSIVLYMVPSISLILQSMREWSDNANIKHNYMAVCSDKSTGEDGSITELESPVSTDSEKLKKSIRIRPRDAMTVIFCTYHSIDVIKNAMKGQAFDVILCDEAHRTTGVEDKSFFTAVHKDSNISGKKRLYMTATPRVYSDVIQARMGKSIYSMDDEERYGPDFYNLSFTQAVRQGILSDFRVKIAIVPADRVDADFQQSVAGDDSSIPLDERTQLAAVWHGLQYPDDDKTPKLLQRVIAFANRIDRSMMFAGKITDGNDVNRSFQNIVEQYEKKFKSGNAVEVEHIDGKTRALERRTKMRWLDESTDDIHTCRIVSNAKCLSEGVDVPALDGVIFLNPRKSRVDVVQSVGRVMRKSPGKDYGYVILPVAIPAGIAYHEALDDNKTFKIVWQVLNALRSHDENFGAEINKLVLDKNPENTNPTPRISISVLDEDFTEKEIVTKFFSKIKSKLVEKVGDFDYYDKYGQKLGEATHTIEARLKTKIKADSFTKTQIAKFHAGLKEMINESVTEEATVQAISQHMVLSRVFDELFAGEFTSHNPISVAFEKVIGAIGLREELRELDEFYGEVKREVSEIKTREARQNFIKKIYGNFFQSADKKGTEQHGIVYTPVEVIDFIINSVEYLLQENFGMSFNDRAIKVLDPFTGTGTFITRLLESGYITTNLYEKYKHDLFANEMILLAYYIATVNIETTYSSLRNSGKYVPFNGVNYTDTLRLNPQYREDPRHRQKQTIFDNLFKKALQRVDVQRKSHLHIILGNPPYSAGQKSMDDDNPNISYPILDERIKNTYATIGKSKKITLYDSYIRAIRWATDRVGQSGIIAFVTNASFIKTGTTSGIRAYLEKEFSEIWCFNLRGDQRTHGETSRKEGGKIFGKGSRAPVAITILIKNPNKSRCIIHYKDIGDYLSRERKLELIKNFKSIRNINDWKKLESDKDYDWINQRKSIFSTYIPIGDKSKNDIPSLFKIYSTGVNTSRDTWVYNSSKKILVKNMKNHINFCNSQNLEKPVIDTKRGSWAGELQKRLKRGKHQFNENHIRKGLYRPFYKQYLYYNRIYNWTLSLTPKSHPETDSLNITICIPDKGKVGTFSCLITDIVPDHHIIEQSQCFPFYTYENKERKENITSFALNEYHEFYNDPNITKKDIFYYVYGLLHHPQYRKKYANNLAKELPHIPMAPKFWEFVKTGKALADLHLNYEVCKKYDLGKPKHKSFGKYDKLSFPKKKVNNKNVSDLTKIRINGLLAFENIPEINYKVNGRTPLEWIVDRYKTTVHKESRIVNAPGDIDIIPVIQRAVYVGVESDKLIRELPVEFEPKDWEPKKIGIDAFVDSASAQTRL